MRFGGTRLTRTLVLLSGASLILLFSAADSPDASHQKLVLNAFSPASTGMAGPVTTSKALKAGRQYLVVVRGTYSAYDATLMNGSAPGWKVCGSPVSPDPKNGADNPEGQDAEFIFAIPRPTHANCPPLPFVDPNFVISTTGPSGPFVHMDPIGGPPTAVDPHHRYLYEITGSGTQASFALLDSNTTDNYGQLVIRVHACGNDGCDADDAGGDG